MDLLQIRFDEKPPQYNNPCLYSENTTNTPEQSFYKIVVRARDMAISKKTSRKTKKTPKRVKAPKKTKKTPRKTRTVRRASRKASGGRTPGSGPGGK